MLILDIRITAWRDREIIVVLVPHLIGPCYLRPEGHEKRTRLRKLVSQVVLAEIGAGPKDPKKVYVLKERRNV